MYDYLLCEAVGAFIFYFYNFGLLYSTQRDSRPVTSEARIVARWLAMSNNTKISFFRKNIFQLKYLIFLFFIFHPRVIIRNHFSDLLRLFVVVLAFDIFSLIYDFENAMNSGYTKSCLEDILRPECPLTGSLYALNRKVLAGHYKQ